MTMYTIPADIFADLLMNIEGEIYPASPFRFLLDAREEASLEGHVAWLRGEGYLAEETGDDGRLALLPELERSLQIAARPIRRITASEVRPDDTRRAVYVCDEAEVSVAMFDQESCIVSDPANLEAFHAAMVEAIGTREAGSASPLQIHPAALTLLGAVAGPFGPDDEFHVRPPSGGDGSSWPLKRSQVETRAAEVLEDGELAESLITALLEDEILSAENGKLMIHDSFEPWHRALNSGHILEMERIEYPGGDLQQAALPVRAYFFGPSGERVLMWPADDDSGEVLLTTPTPEELRKLVGYLVGYVEA